MVDTAAQPDPEATVVDKAASTFVRFGDWLIVKRRPIAFVHVAVALALLAVGYEPRAIVVVVGIVALLLLALTDQVVTLD